MRKLEVGMRVRLKARTMMCCWRGTATIVEPDLGMAIKDGYVASGGWRDRGTVEACRHEWAILRDQTPSPEHRKVTAVEEQSVETASS